MPPKKKKGNAPMASAPKGTATESAQETAQEAGKEMADEAPKQSETENAS